jgi:hypothetical protein
MLDSPKGVCAGQARFEYPATFVLFSNCLTSGVLIGGEAKGPTPSTLANGCPWDWASQLGVTSRGDRRSRSSPR